MPTLLRNSFVACAVLVAATAHAQESDIKHLAPGFHARARRRGRISARDRAAAVWLDPDEIKRGQYEESLVLFDRLLARKPADPEVLYARGEVYRLRGDKDDLPRALDDLSRAAGAQKPPAETFRSLGLVQKQLGNAQAAAEAFDRYLALDPHAPDAGLLRSYLSDLKS